MTADVSLSTVAPRPTAVVSQTTTWQQFPSAWKPLLDEVYGFVSGREADLAPHGGPEVWRNAFLYLGHWREDAGELETRDLLPRAKTGYRRHNQIACACSQLVNAAGRRRA